MVNVPKDIMFYTVILKMVILYAKESHDLKHSSENSKRKSVLSSFVQRVTGFSRRLITKEKK